MAMDDTDKKLTKGLLWAAIFGIVAYFFPYYGYQAQKAAEADQRAKLEATSTGYSKHFPPMHSAHMGLTSSQPIEAPTGTYISELQAQYKETNNRIDEFLESKQTDSRMNFPAWTEVPETNKKDPGVYFVQMWTQKRTTLFNEWRAKGIDCLDSDIGFGKFTGIISSIDLIKAQELLRELHIAENIIRLCISAKVAEEAFERANSVQPEAFMRIISVTPLESEPTKPTEIVRNLQFNEKETNPNSPKFRRYNIKSYKPFIQEYPIEIVLQCDINTFMRFLHSVRNPGSFLVIRSLEITSPFVDESQLDKSDLRIFQQPTETKDKEKRAPLERMKDEHVLVKMSAAGMDFFDPAQYPNGLYNAKAAKPGATVRKRREIKQ